MAGPLAVVQDDVAGQDRLTVAASSHSPEGVGGLERRDDRFRDTSLRTDPMSPSVDSSNGAVRSFGQPCARGST